VAAVAIARSGEETDPLAAASANFAEVVRSDLVEVQSYDATLGTVAGDPVTSQRTGTVTSSVAEGDTAESGDVLFAIDGEPVVLMSGTSPAWRDLTETEDTDIVVNRANGTVTDIVEAGTVLEEGDVAYWVNGEPVTVLYGDVPAYRAMYDASTNLEGDDILQLETYLDASGYDDIGISVDGEFTNATESVVENWQEDIGATVDGRVELGEVIFIPGPAEVVAVDAEIGDTVGDGSPVMALAGDTPMQGEDVRQLEENLVALGYDAGGALTVDDVFDAATSEAIEAWEADLGVEVDGTVALGDVFFASTAVRVSERLASPGTNVTPGVAVLAVSSADKVVTLDLPAEDQDLVEVGVAVVVELPDGTDVPGTVTEVATVASVDQQGNAVFEVTIELDDPSAAAGLDEAPVDVELITDSVENVIAVPVTALLALSEGGYAVEVRTADGTTRLVAVDPGFFADGLVEVRSDGLQPGDEVVVP
jgi:peptidoglycan hydrolase-like protein with peptidoglycan-binding domain